MPRFSLDNVLYVTLLYTKYSLYKWKCNAVDAFSLQYAIMMANEWKIFSIFHRQKAITYKNEMQYGDII